MAEDDMQHTPTELLLERCATPLEDIADTTELIPDSTEPTDFVDLPTDFAEVWCDDQARQGAAFQRTLTRKGCPVDWTYEIWNTLPDQLRGLNDRSRSITAEVLCGFAERVRQQRLLGDFPALFDVVSGTWFVMARHAVPATGEIGFVLPRYRQVLGLRLEQHFKECSPLNHCTSIRHDLIEWLRKWFHATRDDSTRFRAFGLLERETDAKYAREHASIWRNT